jgi:S-adenosylmethionine:diacylglycerol 3-amino-3-carboxypropyl transferase
VGGGREDVVTAVARSVWERGRLDARTGDRQVLFGSMYEDPAIELAAFAPGSRVLCIASAGDTAMALAPAHEVTAVDINPVQLAYARERLAGGPVVRGTAERVMGAMRALAPLVGWSRKRLQAFVELADPDEQAAYWRSHLDTRRFRIAFGTLMSVRALRLVYSSPLLACLPARLARVMRGRMQRCFAHHANRDNPFARLLLLGEAPQATAPDRARDVRLVQADAAAFLEASAPASFDGFTLSNITDGVDAAYRARLFAAVRHAAAPGATIVLRSFSEPATPLATNQAERDRSMLWGVVDVRPVADLAT